MNDFWLHYSFCFIWFFSNFFIFMYISTLWDFQIFDDIFQMCAFCGHVKWCFYLKWISIFIVQDEPEPAKYQRIRRLSIYPGKGNFYSLSKIQRVPRLRFLRTQVLHRNIAKPPYTLPFFPFHIFSLFKLDTLLIYGTKYYVAIKTSVPFHGQWGEPFSKEAFIFPSRIRQMNLSLVKIRPHEK